MLYWILAVLAAAAMGYWVYRADKQRGTPYPWLTAGLRALVVFLTIVLLIAPAFTINKQRTEKPILVYLHDNSESIATALGADSAKYRNDVTGVLKDLEDKFQIVRWGFGSGVQKDTLFDYTQPTTDIAEALSRAVDFYGQQNLGAIILATDGRFNRGLDPGFQQLSFGGPLYTVALGDSAPQADIRIQAVYANTTVNLNSQFEIRADIVANSISGYQGRVSLVESGRSESGSVNLSVNNQRFDKTVSFTVKADRPGLHHYVLTVSPAEGEINTSNNRRDVFVEVVAEKKKILLAAFAPHPDVKAIRDVITASGSYEVFVRTFDQLPASVEEFDVLILHSLPAQGLPMRQLTGNTKPTWWIMGTGSDNMVMNQLQQMARLNVNTRNLQHQFAGLESDFLSFTLSPGAAALIEKLPPLAVPAGMIEQGPGAEVLIRSRNPQQPLWLLADGRPSGALLIGEGLWRWRMHEYRQTQKNEVVDELIRQTVTFLASSVAEKPFSVVLAKNTWSDRESVFMQAFLLNRNNEQVNSPDATISISDSAGRKQQYSFERFGNAYRLNIGIRPAGTYSYTAEANLNGVRHTAAGSFAVQQIPVEMMETGANYPMLHQLARKYEGALIPGAYVASLADSVRNNQNIQPVIRNEAETIPLVDWKWYFFLILLIAATEWLLRKWWMAM